MSDIYTDQAKRDAMKTIGSLLAGGSRSRGILILIDRNRNELDHLLQLGFSIDEIFMVTKELKTYNYFVANCLTSLERKLTIGHRDAKLVSNIVEDFYAAGGSADRLCLDLCGTNTPKTANEIREVFKSRFFPAGRAAVVISANRRRAPEGEDSDNAKRVQWIADVIRETGRTVSVIDHHHYQNDKSNTPMVWAVFEISAL